MDQPFTITADRGRHFITIAFHGVFWDEGTRHRFVAECVTALMSLGCELGTQVILVDLRNAILQSQSMIASMQKFLADPRGGRIALVAATPLARMQTKRLQVRDDVRMFPDIDSAEFWLFHPDADTAAA